MKIFKTSRRHGQPNLMLQFAAGAYLIFLAFDLVKQYITDPDKNGKLIFLLAGIAFGLIGIFLAIVASRRYYKGTSGTSHPVDEAGECRPESQKKNSQ